MKEAVLAEVQMDDFTGDIAMLADVIGLEKMKEVVKKLGGLQFYISKSAFITATERYIVKNGRRFSIKQLAVDTEMTERQVYDILASRKIDVKSHSLFPEAK